MNKYLIPALVSLTVFIVSMIVLFSKEYEGMNALMMSACLIYALVCLFFLFFQLYAFIRAHAEYDHEVESLKYQVFHAENIPIESKEII